MRLPRLRSKSTPGLAARIRIQPGRVEALPIEDSSVDLVWCRDVLSLVADLESAYSEFARVLRSGGTGVVCQSCMAPELTDQEAERFWAPLDAAVNSADPAKVEAAIASSGLHMDRWFNVALEWGQSAAETNGTPGHRLLHLSRLLQQPDRYVEKFGRWAYDVMVADCLWHVYRLMGKTEQRVYVLTKPI